MNRISKMLLGATLAISIMATAYAAQSPLAISADKLEYNANQSIVKVAGNVEIDQDGTHMTGDAGWYNTKTKEAFLQGNVHMNGENREARANEIHIFGNERIVAQGNAYYQDGSQVLEGDYINYNQVTGYGLVEGDALVKDAEYQLTAPKVEIWSKKILAKGTGGVEIRNPKQNLYAKGNAIEYTQTPNKKDGVAYVTGDAYVEQNGSTFTGDKLKVYMETNTVETESRSTIVIQPQ